VEAVRIGGRAGRRATGVAQLIVKRLIADQGAARTMLVNYLLPMFALVYGAGILDEPLTVAKVAGLVLILIGVTLASGVLPGLPRVAAAITRGSES
jgi:drug/metabolite transporter (DMT)-like permease